MRFIPLLISGIVTIALIVVLNRPFGAIPPVGSLLAPQHGFWQNAEPEDNDFDLDINFPQLKEKVEVYLDERLVPHVFAQNNEDLFFVQGYLHAKFRLWQMEFQTHAAAGRLTEILGAGDNNDILNFDRNMRRIGMVYGARNSLKMMEADPATKLAMDAYTDGVNSYISNLPVSELPLEYRLLNYKPERWTNLKSALFMKYMSYNLSAAENDIEYTNARNIFNKEDFNLVYPVTQDSLDPIIPRGTNFPPPSVLPKMPANVDSVYFQWNDIAQIIPLQKPDRDNGSNNWAVNGTKTESGRPILCNDPHLNLNLPSLWYEMQLNTPGFNVYGVTFPGAPSVIIGFNDHIAWGVTNSERDVKDYYKIHFKDATRTQYRFNGNWKEAELHVDTFHIKDGPAFLDTVSYTVFGPVQYDAGFTGDSRAKGFENLAVRWKAHDGSNELKTFLLLNKAANYTDFLDAIKDFSCPGQNFVFASKSNEIAIWQQGKFPAKWRRQGDFIMPGIDSSYLWKEPIPRDENPHLENPVRGFVSSANQLPADTTYPYYLGGSYPLYRGITINRYLRQMNNITPRDMKTLQTLNYNVFAEMAMPVLLQNINEETLTPEEKEYLDIARSWEFYNDPVERGPVVFTVWFNILEKEIWDDDLETAPKPIMRPYESTTLEALLKQGNAFKFIDNITTPGQETLADIVTGAFKKAVPELERIKSEGRLEWSKYKDSGVRHLLRQGPLSRFHLTTGGGLHVINATKQYHGPSWRMIVQLSDKVEAYGIYPGGQSGNAGSRYYDNFIENWANSKYYTLWVMTKEEVNDKRIIGKMTFNKGF